MKVYIVYGVDKLHTRFNKTVFKKHYLVLLISNIIVLFSNLLKAILSIILYKNQLK